MESIPLLRVYFHYTFHVYYHSLSLHFFHLIHGFEACVPRQLLTFLITLSPSTQQ